MQNKRSVTPVRTLGTVGAAAQVMNYFPSKRQKDGEPAINQARHRAQPQHKTAFEDVERPMLRHIRELEERLAMVEPQLRVRDVEATGSCFFLCGNLARQDLGHSARTCSDEQLRAAADDDRLAVVALMIDRLAEPLADGDTLETKLNLTALIEAFPGTNEVGCALSHLRSLTSFVRCRCGQISTKLLGLHVRAWRLGRSKRHRRVAGASELWSLVRFALSIAAASAATPSRLHPLCRNSFPFAFAFL